MLTQLRAAAIQAMAGGDIVPGPMISPVGKGPASIALTGEATRGACLTRAQGCLVCHTAIASDEVPLAVGAHSRSAVFPGNQDLPGGAKVPSLLLVDPRAWDWTVANFAFALRTSAMPDWDDSGDSMDKVVQGKKPFEPTQT